MQASPSMASRHPIARGCRRWGFSAAPFRNGRRGLRRTRWAALVEVERWAAPSHGQAPEEHDAIPPRPREILHQRSDCWEVTQSRRRTARGAGYRRGALQFVTSGVLQGDRNSRPRTGVYQRSEGCLPGWTPARDRGNTRHAAAANLGLHLLHAANHAYQPGRSARCRLIGQRC